MNRSCRIDSRHCRLLPVAAQEIQGPVQEEKVGGRGGADGQGRGLRIRRLRSIQLAVDNSHPDIHTCSLYLARLAPSAHISWLP